MKNSFHIVITILVVILVICITLLYCLSSERRELLEELKRLRNERKEADVQMSDTSSAIENVNHQITFLKQNANGEKLQNEIGQLEIRKEILEQIRKEKETAAAFERANLGHATMGYSVGEDEVADRRQKVRERQEGLETRFQQFNEFIQNCDLTALLEQERKTLADYMELRKKWNDIIYDPQVADEEKIETYKACQALDNQVGMILDKLFNSQFSEEYVAFKALNDKLQRIFHNDTQLKHKAIIHITNEKGEKEEVIHVY